MLTSPQKELLKKKRVEKRKRTKKKPPEDPDFDGRLLQKLSSIIDLPSIISYA
jgi:hypothetical protein